MGRPVTLKPGRLGLNEAGWLGLVAAGVFFAALAALTVQAVPRGWLPEPPRCYWIAPPLTHFQPVLLQRGFLDCALTECQLTVHPIADAGWVCFFPKPWG